jgi:hypothetical protein
MFDLPCDKPPEFVNEKGVKWWKDEHTTAYAQKENHNGKKLDAVCWYIEEPCGRRTRVLIGKNGKFLGENQSLEGIGCRIDVLKFLA